MSKGCKMQQITRTLIIILLWPVKVLRFHTGSKHVLCVYTILSVPYPEFKAPDLHKYYQHTTCLHLLIVGNCTGLEVTWDQ